MLIAECAAYAIDILKKQQHHSKAAKLLCHERRGLQLLAKPRTAQ
jgi:hypothetical protein